MVGGSFPTVPRYWTAKRNSLNIAKSQLENLTWLEMDWDEGPDSPGKYGP